MACNCRKPYWNYDLWSHLAAMRYDDTSECYTVPRAHSSHPPCPIRFLSPTARRIRASWHDNCCRHSKLPVPRELQSSDARQALVADGRSAQGRADLSGGFPQPHSSVPISCQLLSKSFQALALRSRVCTDGCRRRQRGTQRSCRIHTPGSVLPAPPQNTSWSRQWHRIWRMVHLCHSRGGGSWWTLKLARHLPAP